MNGEDRVLKSRLLPGRAGDWRRERREQSEGNNFKGSTKDVGGKMEGQNMWLPEPRGTMLSFQMEINSLQDITESKAENQNNFCVTSTQSLSAQRPNCKYFLP